MKKIIALFSIIFLCFGCIENRTEQPDTNDLKKDSILNNTVTSQSQDDKTQLLSYDKILDNNISDSASDIIKAALLVKGNKHLDGLRMINQIIKERPKDHFALFMKGVMITYIYPDAVDSMYYFYDKAIILNPKSLYYLSTRAAMYFDDKNYDKSIQDYNSAIKVWPNRKELFVLRGIAYYKFHDYDKALKDLKVIPASYKKETSAYIAKAHSLLLTGQFSESIKNCDTILMIDSNTGFAYAIRGVAKTQLDEFEAGVEDLKIGASLGDVECKKQLIKLAEYQKTHKQL